MTVIDLTYCDQEADAADRRRRLARVAWVCLVAVVLALLATTGPSDLRIAGASSGQTFDEWYAQPENQDWYHFNEWYGDTPRNASYYHLREHFGTGHLGDQAVRVALCESELNPRAVSPTNDHGVLQINARYHRTQFERVTGTAWSPNVYHADLNAEYARWLYEQSGWQPWTCRGAA